MNDFESAESLFINCCFDEALPLLEKLVEQGNAKAMYCIGEYYRYGYGSIVKDYEKALYWWKKSAENGYAVAEMMTGCEYDIYSEERHMIYNSTKTSVMKLVKSGDIFAQCELGAWLDGDYDYICGKDKRKGRDLLRKAVEKGYFKAMYLLGFHYDMGHGSTEKNSFEKAVYWNEKSASKGHALSIMVLIYIYTDSPEVYYASESEKAEYLKKARFWYNKALELGFTEVTERFKDSDFMK
ncbi:MAG: sel1 repeat family protein [Ruminococcus sp.]|nr:sel1 repeat family protein [Ruminococcus sp.]